MRRPILVSALAVVLLVPTVLAFFAGGYFDGGRLVTATVVWLLLCLLGATGQLQIPGARQDVSWSAPWRG